MKNISISRKQLLILIPVITVALVGGAFALRSFNSPATTADNRENTSSDTEAASEASLPEDDTNVSTDEEKKVPIQYEGESPSNSSELTGIINFKSVIEDNLTIRVTIDQSLSNGSCQLTLSRLSDDKTVTKSAGIVQNPSSSACDGFSVPVAELESGNWSIEVQISDGERSGLIKESVDI